MTEVPIIQKPLIYSAMDWFLCDRDLRHERFDFQNIYSKQVHNEYRRIDLKLEHCIISHCTKIVVFHYGFFQQMRPNLKETTDLITFIEENLNGRLFILCSERLNFVQNINTSKSASETSFV